MESCKGFPLSPPVSINLALKSWKLSVLLSLLPSAITAWSFICWKLYTLVLLPLAEYTPLEVEVEFSSLSPGRDPANVYVELKLFKFCNELLFTSTTLPNIFTFLATSVNPSLVWKLLYKGDNTPFDL